MNRDRMLADRIVLVVGAVGAAVFWALYLSSWLRPAAIESFAREAIRFEIQRRVQGEVVKLSEGALATAALKKLGRNEDDMARIRKELAKHAEEEVSRAMDRFRDPECPCRAYFKALHRRVLKDRLAELADVNQRLRTLVESKYVEVAAALLKELRVFSSANAVGFSVLFLLAWFKPQARLQLLLPSTVLVISLAVTACVYLFGQSWLHTLVYNDYVGYSYFAYLGLAFIACADIAFNRCRASSMIFNVIGGLFGALLQAIPC